MTNITDIWLLDLKTTLGIIIVPFIIFFIATFYILNDGKKKVEEIDNKINDFENKEFSSHKEKAGERKRLKKELNEILSQIDSKKHREEAKDKINQL